MILSSFLYIFVKKSNIMKKTILVILMALGTLGYSQNLKGVKLGTVSTYNEFFSTTVAGIEGSIGTRTLNNGVIYRIFFTPSDGDNVKRVYSSDLDLLVSAIETKYNVTLEKTLKNDYSDDYYLAADKNNIQYFLSISINKYASPQYKVFFVITDLALKAKADIEKEKKASFDI